MTPEEPPVAARDAFRGPAIYHRTNEWSNNFIYGLVDWVECQLKFDHKWRKGIVVRSGAQTSVQLIGFGFTIFLGPLSQTDKDTTDPYARGRVLKVVAGVAKVLKSDSVPDGVLGMYRSQIGKKFLENADDLIASWKSGHQLLRLL